MLKQDDNDLLTQVGPGTPMGSLMREYWLPAMLSSELPAADCDPVRVLLLGEKLTAFRNSDGVVGILPANCPHRGAPLFFGQVKDGCLRCVYHGWQYDTSGRVVDMPNETPESDFKDRLPAFGHPSFESAGIVWTYLGSRPEPPPPPKLEFFEADPEKVFVQAQFVRANWLQVLEGDIDTVHASFLHCGHGAPGDAPQGTFMDHAIRHPALKYKLIDTPGGVLGGAYRPAGDTGDIYWRLASFVFPFYAFPSPGVLGAKKAVLITVPMDDTHSLKYSLSVRDGQPSVDPNQRVGLHPDKTPFLPDTTDWYGRHRRAKNMENDYELDRDLQRSGGTYTGITGFNTEDRAMNEGMGPIVDRTQEHLGTTDAMVVRTRRRMLEAVRALRDHRTTPPGVDNPEVYHQRSGGVVLPPHADWLEATEDLRRAGVEHPHLDPALAAGI